MRKRFNATGFAVAGFAIIGTALILYSAAATTPTVGLEAEAGNRSGNNQSLSGDGANGGFVRLNSGSGKPRMIAMTDGEGDDRDSFVRFLLYTNDFEVMGIVPTNSRWQENGHGRGWIDDLIDKYNQVRPNLLLHDSAYPTADYLKSKVAIGIEDINTIWGTPPFADTPGSDLIVAELRKNDPRPLYINAWGGSNTAAQALYRLKTSYPTEYAAAASKARIFTIHSPSEGQDNGWTWIRDNTPEAELIVNASYIGTWDYSGSQNPYNDELKSGNWLNENVKNNHGPLGAAYGQTYISEGDTPAFMPLINNGLRAFEAPGYGGWGGRFNLGQANTWYDAAEGGSVYAPIVRWFPAAQNDFAARMDWCVMSYANANHQPTINLNGGTTRTISPGGTAQLTAQATDPDGDALTYKWWQYDDADSAPAVSITNSTSAAANFTAPNQPGKQIQIILEVTDTGTPALKRYERIIYTIL